MKWSERKKERGKEQPSILEQALKKMVGEARLSNGRKEKTSMVIIDAQSVKNTATAREKGYDAGKKALGIKRHIAVDANGLPRGIKVTAANVTDRDGAIALSKESKENLSRVEKMLVDGGYSGEKFASSVNKIIKATVEVVKRNELHKFKVIPKRRVVERSFS